MEQQFCSCYLKKNGRNNNKREKIKITSTTLPVKNRLGIQFIYTV
jgi:hypothetical protein